MGCRPPVDRGIARACSIIALCTALTAALGITESRAATGTFRAGDVPDSTKRIRRIAVLPIKAPATARDALFSRGRQAMPQLAGVRSVVVNALAAHDFTQVLLSADIRRSLSKSRAATAARRVAQERYQLGLQYYMSMAFDRAADSMRRAALLYRDEFQDVIDPKPLADAHLIRGVSLVHAGLLPAAHVAFKEMFVVQPDRVFSRRGFYGPDVDKALIRALEDHAATGKHAAPYGDPERLEKLASTMRVAAIFVGAIEMKAGRPLLLLSSYHSEHRVFGGRLRVDVSDLAQAGSRVAARIDAFVSRMLTCLPVQDRGASGRKTAPGHVWMDTSAIAGAFTRKPTRLQFFSFGAAGGYEREVRPGFGYFGRFNVLTSLPDPYRDLISSFNSLRGIFGVSFSLTRGRVRVFLRPGLEAHVLGAAITSRDPDCKFFGIDSFKCDKTPAFTKNLEQDILVGVNAALGIQVSVGRGFFTTVQASGAFYILPLDGARDLNLPLMSELGLGYRF